VQTLGYCDDSVQNDTSTRSCEFKRIHLPVRPWLKSYKNIQKVENGLYCVSYLYIFLYKAWY